MVSGTLVVQKNYGEIVVIGTCNVLLVKY